MYKNLTRFISLTSILWLFLISGCSPNTGNTTQGYADTGSTRAEARATGKATLTVLYVEADGFAYRNADGELDGLTVDIMRDFVSWFERYHATQVELNFVAEANWQTFYQRIVNAQGGVFGLGNVTITEARKAELQFSPAYLDNVAVLITNADTPELASWEEFPETFAGLQPLAFAGTLHEQRIQALRDEYQPNGDIRLVTSNPEILSLVADDGYYSYIDAYNYWRAVEQGVALKHHPIANEIGETFGIIMPHNNDWSVLLTAFFAAEGGYRNTERYQTLLTHHLGAELAATLEEARRQNSAVE